MVKEGSGCGVVVVVVVVVIIVVVAVFEMSDCAATTDCLFCLLYVKNPLVLVLSV